MTGSASGQELCRLIRCFRRVMACYRRQIGSSGIAATTGVLIVGGMLSFAVHALEYHHSEPLEFGFIDNPPGIRVALETHGLHAHCTGTGDITVLFEPGLGGSALEWYPVRERLDRRVTACVYDRAGYAWSDPSPFRRDAAQIAREADQLLARLGIDGPLILIGHSFGGFVVRQLARLRDEQIIGLVLVDASHEDQFERMQGAGTPPVLPRGRNFVIDAADVPDNLPPGLRRKVAAFARMRKTYVATHGELASFRRSAEQLKARPKPVEYPIWVLRRGRDVFRDPGRSAGEPDSMKHVQWIELQEDLARLSSRGHVVVAAASGHHIHVDEPQLVADAVEELLDAYKNGRQHKQTIEGDSAVR